MQGPELQHVQQQQRHKLLNLRSRLHDHGDRPVHAGGLLQCAELRAVPLRELHDVLDVCCGVRADDQRDVRAEELERRRLRGGCWVCRHSGCRCRFSEPPVGTCEQQRRTGGREKKGGEESNVVWRSLESRRRRHSAHFSVDSLSQFFPCPLCRLGRVSFAIIFFLSFFSSLWLHVLWSSLRQCRFLRQVLRPRSLHSYFSSSSFAGLLVLSDACRLSFHYFPFISWFFLCFCSCYRLSHLPLSRGVCMRVWVSPLASPCGIALFLFSLSLLSSLEYRW